MAFFANLALMVTQEVVVVVVVLVAVRKCHDLFIIVDRLLLRDHKSLSPNCVMTHHLTRVILDESKRIESRGDGSTESDESRSLWWGCTVGFLLF